MSFDVDVEKRLGEARVSARFTTGGGLTALFGPSGAGKSSTLNMVAGLLRPDSGRVAVAGQVFFDSARGIDLPPEARRIGYIFQDARLFPHRSVRRNLDYGRKRRNVGRPAVDFDEVVGFLGIGHLLPRWPATLSGGEAQRVAIGRALLSGAEVLLMDEPLSSLDAPRKAEIAALIERLRDDFRIPILYVTHDEREVGRLASEVVEFG